MTPKNNPPSRAQEAQTFSQIASQNRLISGREFARIVNLLKPELQRQVDPKINTELGVVSMGGVGFHMLGEFADEWSAQKRKRKDRIESERLERLYP